MLPEKSEARVLLLAAALYAFLYLAFWPPITTTMDEAAYLNFGYVLRQGTFYADTAGINLPMTISAAQHLTIKYPPGMPLVLAALSVLGWKVALGANLLVHLATFGVVARLLRVAGGSPLFALLFLFHPTAVIYSRTVMSDPLGGLLVASAFLAGIRQRPLLAGVLLGLSILVKTANGFVLALFALGFLLEKQGRLKEARDVGLLVLGALPGAIGAYVYQKVVQEGGWAKYSAPGQFTAGYFLQHFPFYLGALLLVFPGMLVGLMLYRGVGRWPLLLSTAGVVLFYSAYYFIDSGGTALESFVVGQRFLLAVLPLIVVAYGVWLTRLLPARLVLRGMPLVGLVLLASAGLVHLRHQKTLRTLEQIRREVAASVPESATLACNVHVGKLLHPGWTGKRAYFLLEDTTEALLAQLETKRAQGPVFIALYSRAGRPETPAELALLEAIHTRFTVRPIATGIEGFVLEELVAQREPVR